jgi:hypothetical protein
MSYGIAGVIAASIVLAARRALGRLGTPPLRCEAFLVRQVLVAPWGSPMEKGAVEVIEPAREVRERARRCRAR